jgi:hypothetical protein
MHLMQMMAFTNDAPAWPQLSEDNPIKPHRHPGVRRRTGSNSMASGSDYCVVSAESCLAQSNFRNRLGRKPPRAACLSILEQQVGGSSVDIATSGKNHAGPKLLSKDVQHIPYP